MNFDPGFTEALDAFDLDFGGANGHENVGLDFETGAREGDALCMVAWSASGGGRK